MALETCPRCDSGLVQPLSSSRRADGLLAVELRCPECEARLRVSATDEEVVAYEEHCDGLRAAIKHDYERCVVESMEALADVLSRALALDLVSADDFAVGRLHSPSVRRLRPAR